MPGRTCHYEPGRIPSSARYPATRSWLTQHDTEGGWRSVLWSTLKILSLKGRWEKQKRISCSYDFFFFFFTSCYLRENPSASSKNFSVNDQKDKITGPTIKSISNFRCTRMWNMKHERMKLTNRIQKSFWTPVRMDYSDAAWFMGCSRRRQHEITWGENAFVKSGEETGDTALVQLTWEVVSSSNSFWCFILHPL